MELGSVVFAFLAGTLSSLSPCVLPILPIVLGAALGQHRLGPAALAGGLALSFTGVGLLIATVGFAAGFDAGLFRSLGAVVLLTVGLVLLVPRFEQQFAMAASPVSSWAGRHANGVRGEGLWGQAGLGVLLGIVWSPCVGPTLGAASLMAARGENLGAVAVVMLAFGIGAALPLLALGTLSREALLRWRGRLMSSAKRGKMVLGIAAIATAIAVMSGVDKRLEAWALDSYPDWLTALTVRF